MAYSPRTLTRNMPNPVVSFTEREAQLLEFASQGFSDKKISQLLDLSLTTVSTYWKRLFRKTGIATRTEAVAIYQRQQSDKSIKALKTQLLALEVRLLKYNLEQKLDPNPEVLDLLLKSIADLNDWLQMPINQTDGSGMGLAHNRENRLAFGRLELIFESARVLNDRIEIFLQTANQEKTRSTTT